MNTGNTGCSDCDKIQAEMDDGTRLCLEHELDYLEWCADSVRKKITKKTKRLTRKGEL